MSLPTFDMQCVDCHNRAAHSFELPDHARRRAMASGEIAAGCRSSRRPRGLLKAEYTSGDEAAAKDSRRLRRSSIAKNIRMFRRQRGSDIQAAGQALIAAIYRRNVFPDLKVTWGTYPNNLGHTDFPGCFRCHDECHATADKKTITQDCSTCHNALAVEEAAPDVLKTLGLADCSQEIKSSKLNSRRMRLMRMILTTAALAALCCTAVFAADAKAGKDVYDKSCKSCHGATGTPGGNGQGDEHQGF